MKPALIPVIAAVLGAGACQNLPVERTPARLAHADDLAADLAKALNRPRVEIGAIDTANATIIPVLPPRSGLYEGNTPALPELFKVYQQGGECWLLNETGTTFYRLEGRACVPTTG